MGSKEKRRKKRNTTINQSELFLTDEEKAEIKAKVKAAEARSLGRLKTVEIKDVDRNQAFVRNWDFSKTDNILKRIQNKKILVIDDNVRSGGTFQTINKILWNKGNPSRVDYYAPLFANFSTKK